MASNIAAYKYDARGRVTEVTFANGSKISYKYDSMGNRTSVMEVAPNCCVTPPGGSNTQVQFNDNGVFGGDAGLLYDKVNDRLTLTGPLKSVTQIEDSDGNEELKFASVASAVNEFTVKNAATGNPPELQATGDDTNIDVNVVPKGTGKLKQNGTAVALSGANADITSMTALSGALKAPSEVQDSGGVKVVEFGAGDDGEHLKIGTISNVPTLEAIGTSANIGLDLKTKGTGQVTINGSPITGGSPGGSDTQVQFNDGGAFGGDAGLVYDKANDRLTLTGPLKSVTQIEDSNGNEELKFASVASAVNEFTVKNAATGNAPELQATGGDTNIDVNVVPKGTGKLKQNGTAVALSGANADITSMSGLTGALRAPTQIEDSNGNEELKFASVASAVNEFTVKNAATGNAPELQATGGDTNIDVNVVPKGTGKLKQNGTAIALSGANTDITSMSGLTGALKAPSEVQDSGGLKILEFGAGDDGEHFKVGTISNVPTLEAVGTSANVGLNLKTKGTGQVTVNGSPITGGSPGGSDTQVQFNDGGAFGGDSGFTYNKTTDTATLGALILSQAVTRLSGSTRAATKQYVDDLTASLNNYFGDSSDGALTVSAPTFIGDTTDDNDFVIKKYSSLTINSGGLLTTLARKKALLIYTTGDLTINAGGILHMNGKGANATASAATLNKLASNPLTGQTFSSENNNQVSGTSLTAFTSVQTGGVAGTAGANGSSSSNGGVGGNGGTITNGTGGGGGGGGACGNNPRASASGAAGTAYCGGSGGGGGGGGATNASGGSDATAGGANGGAGGTGANARESSGSNKGGGGGGGAGNPRGEGGLPGHPTDSVLQTPGGDGGVQILTRNVNTGSGYSRAVSAGRYVFMADVTNSQVKVYDSFSADHALDTTISSISEARLYLSVDKTKIYCISSDSNLRVISVSSRSVTNTYNIGGGNYDLCQKSDGSKLYIRGNGVVRVVNASDGNVDATVTVGSGSTASSSAANKLICILPNDTKVYTINASANTVSVIATSNNTVTATITVGTSPDNIGAVSNSKVYCAQGSTSAVCSIAIIATSSDTVSSTLNLEGGSSERAYDLTFNSDKSKAYVPTSNDNVKVVTTSSDTVSATIAITGTYTNDTEIVVVDPTDDNVGYVTCNGTTGNSGSVVKLNLSNNTIDTILNITGRARALAISPCGQKVYWGCNSNDVGQFPRLTGYGVIHIPAGGGGTVFLVCGGTLTINGHLTAYGSPGGPGGDGAAAGGSASAGGGGGGGGSGGGRIITLYRTAYVNSTGVLSAAGGPGGASGSNGAQTFNGGVGGSGGAGAVTTSQIL